MESNQEAYERIEDFLAGRLSGQELVAFENDVANDPDLAKAVELHRGLRKALGDEKRVAMKTLLADVGDAYQKEKAEPSSKKWTWRIAAALLVLVGLSATFWLVNSEGVQSDELFATYFEPYPAYQIKRNSPDNDTDHLTNAFEAYEQKAYEKAGILFEKAITEKPSPLVHFYRGICLLKTGQANGAVEQFDLVLQHGDNFYLEQAEWYLSLSYLQAGKEEEAHALFLKIAGKEGHSYQRQSAALLEDWAFSL